MSSAFLAPTARLTRRTMTTTLVVAVLLALAAVAIAPLIGIEPTSEGWRVRWIDLDAAFQPGTTDYIAFWQVRLPRVLAAAMVGGALAVSGASFQALLRNPLAEPFTLGISSGAGLAAVIAIRLGLGGLLGGLGVDVAALLGAAASVAVVWRLARVGGSLPPATLLLAGITVSMFCSAASMFILHTAELSSMSQMLRWMLGGFHDRQSGLGLAAVLVAGGATVLIGLGRDFNALAAGPDAAASVGVSVGRTQGLGFAAASLLVGTAVALAGPIGFVGLVVPHALRALVGPDHRLLLPTAIPAGAALLVICDTISRVTPTLNRLPVGVVTALFGAPFFAMILLGEKRRAGLWGR